MCIMTHISCKIRKNSSNNTYIKTYAYKNYIHKTYACMRVCVSESDSITCYIPTHVCMHAYIHAYMHACVHMYVCHDAHKDITHAYASLSLSLYILHTYAPLSLCIIY
jgi:hypothetical protein